jgi:hypothetical protein
MSKIIAIYIWEFQATRKAYAFGGSEPFWFTTAVVHFTFEKDRSTESIKDGV